MKMFNGIILLSVVTIVGVVFGMEKELTHKKIIVVDNRNINSIISGVINYRDQHQAELYKTDTANVTFFPVEKTSPVPIEYCGSQRFFMTSARQDQNAAVEGRVLGIVDPQVKQVVAVSGRVKSNDSKFRSCRINLYLGLKTDEVQSLEEGNKKVYPANVMAFDTKQRINKRKYDYGMHNTNEVEMFDDGVFLMEEVKNTYPEIAFCAENAFLLQPCVENLIGERSAQFLDYGTLKFHCTADYLRNNQ